MTYSSARTFGILQAQETFERLKENSTDEASILSFLVASKNERKPPIVILCGTDPHQDEDDAVADGTLTAAHHIGLIDLRAVIVNDDDDGVFLQKARYTFAALGFTELPVLQGLRVKSPNPTKDKSRMPTAPRPEADFSTCFSACKEILKNAPNKGVRILDIGSMGDLQMLMQMFDDDRQGQNYLFVEKVESVTLQTDIATALKDCILPDLSEIEPTNNKYNESATRYVFDQIPESRLKLCAVTRKATKSVPIFKHDLTALSAEDHALAANLERDFMLKYKDYFLQSISDEPYRPQVPIASGSARLSRPSPTIQPP